MLSFWLGQNLSYKQPPLSPFTKGEPEGFPPSGNDNHWERVHYEEPRLALIIFLNLAKRCVESFGPGPASGWC